MPPHPTTSFYCRRILQRAQLAQIQRRYGSTTVQIPPESPQFVNIPKLHQPQIVPRVMNKGTLPVPRKIFRRTGDVRTTPEYLARTTQEPTRTRNLDSLRDQDAKTFLDYKLRSSNLRRQNLRQGLVALQARKNRTDRKIAAVSAHKQANFQARLRKPQREDERLTDSTVVQSLTPEALKTMYLKDHLGNRSSMEDFELRQEAKKAERKDSLHTLYMNAREFIITEEQLRREIDRVFDKEFYKVNEDRGIWDEEGFPESVHWMLNHTSGQSSGKAVDQSHHAVTSRERVQRIAEELTGGKL